MPGPAGRWVGKYRGWAGKGPNLCIGGWGLAMGTWRDTAPLCDARLPPPAWPHAALVRAALARSGHYSGSLSGAQGAGGAEGCPCPRVPALGLHAREPPLGCTPTGREEVVVHLAVDHGVGLGGPPHFTPNHL